MFSTVDKAWAASFASLLGTLGSQFFGIELSPEANSAVVAVLVWLVTFWVPNKAKAK